MLLAAIDIGSNAIRFCMCGGDAPNFPQRDSYLRLPVRLGPDVFRHGRVTREPAAAFLEAMTGLGHIMRACRVARYRACATSALRDAANGRELARRALEVSGLAIDIISGSEEARILFEAHARASGDAGTALCMDVGGGSVELAILRQGAMSAPHSFKLGTERVLAGAADPAERRRFCQCLRALGHARAPERLLFSGGNGNSVARRLEQELGHPPTLEDWRALSRALPALSPEQIQARYGLNAYRAGHLRPALELLLEAAALSGVRHVAVPGLGLVDGLLARMAAKDGAAAGRPWPPETAPGADAQGARTAGYASRRRPTGQWSEP